MLIEREVAGSNARARLWKKCRSRVLDLTDPCLSRAIRLSFDKFNQFHRNLRLTHIKPCTVCISYSEFVKELQFLYDRKFLSNFLMRTLSGFVWDSSEKQFFHTITQ
jgi:hypothetical protein